MTTTRKKTITVESWQKTVIRYNSRPPGKMRCDLCETDVDTATPEQSTAIFDLGLQEIYRGLEIGKLHFIKQGRGLPQICLNSLKDFKN